MKLVNLTPHVIVITDGAMSTVIPSSGVARVASQPGDLQLILPKGYLYSAPTWGQIEGLPAPEEGTMYIVSALVASRAVGRPDVCSPGTGPSDGAIRDDKGQIKAVTRLIQAPQS